MNLADTGGGDGGVQNLGKPADVILGRSLTCYSVWYDWWYKPFIYAWLESKVNQSITDFWLISDLWQQQFYEKYSDELTEDSKYYGNYWEPRKKSWVHIDT